MRFLKYVECNFHCGIVDERNVFQINLRLNNVLESLEIVFRCLSVSSIEKYLAVAKTSFALCHRPISTNVTSYRTRKSSGIYLNVFFARKSLPTVM